MESNIKSAWGEWEIVELLGEGSYGKVYKAVKKDFGAEMLSAIKIIIIPKSQSELKALQADGMGTEESRTYLEGIVNSFVHEIKMMISLNSAPNIVTIYDYKVMEKPHEIGWEIHIRMELLTSFDEYLEGRNLTEKEITKLGTDICSALEFCAKQQPPVIHRDIKPGNIFITEYGEFKLGDFGVARELEKSKHIYSIAGTPNYMAPEVKRGDMYGTAADIYSLGIVLYKLTNENRLPFCDLEKQILRHSDYEEASKKRFAGESMVSPINASEPMAKVILKACEFDPAKRFQSATEFKAALETVTKNVVTKPPLIKWPILAMCLLAIITVICTSLILNNRSNTLTLDGDIRNTTEKIDISLENDLYMPENIEKRQYFQKSFIAPGFWTRFVIKSDGSLWAWGANYEGKRFGNGISESSGLTLTPIKVMDNIIAVATDICEGANHFLAIKKDGSLWAWGDNRNGQLGDGTNEDRKFPVKIMDDVISIVAGDGFLYHYSFALKSDGSLWSWGYNGDGQLGDGTNEDKNVPIKIMDDVKYIEDCFAIKSDGSLWSWGSGNLGDGTNTGKNLPIKIMDDVVSVAGGGRHYLAVKTDGSLWTWGDNRYGQLGNGTVTTYDENREIIHNNDNLVPTQINIDDVAYVARGGAASYAIKKDGSLWAWGDVYIGNVTIENYSSFTPDEKYTPVKILDDVAYVAAGEYSIYAVKRDGSLWVGGMNHLGQLGDGTKTTFLYDEDCTIIGLEDNNKYTMTKLMDNLMMDPNLLPKTEDIEQKQYFQKSVVAANEHVLLIKSNNSLWSWGNNYHGQLGNGATERSLTPIKIMDNIVSVSAGRGVYTHSLAIKKDGGLWAWGSNQYGQLGDGTNEDKLLPIKVMDDIISVAAGNEYSLAIKKDDSLWAWGNGNLGNGTREKSNIPIKIMDDVGSVAAGRGHRFAIKKDGTLWAWGGNSYGQLGDGTTAGKNLPVKIMDDIIFVAAGYNHNLAIKKDGSLWAWGDNRYGQLGDGTVTTYDENNKKINNNDKLIPTQIFIDDVIYVAIEDDYASYAIKKDGSLWAWGHLWIGDVAIADGKITTNNQCIPVKIMDDTAYVAAGLNCVYIVKKDGSFWVGGRNSYGQLGDGTINTWIRIGDSAYEQMEDNNKYTPFKLMEDIMLPE